MLTLSPPPRTSSLLRKEELIGSSTHPLPSRTFSPRHVHKGARPLFFLFSSPPLFPKAKEVTARFFFLLPFTIDPGSRSASYPPSLSKSPLPVAKAKNWKRGDLLLLFPPPLPPFPLFSSARIAPRFKQERLRPFHCFLLSAILEVGGCPRPQFRLPLPLTSFLSPKDSVIETGGGRESLLPYLFPPDLFLFRGRGCTDERL